jgi:glycosyltransferase involved in cell wall biosynthesis
MKLSVLMPVYNEGRWIESVVSKVLKQQVSGIDELELIIVDDGSTDGTTEIIKSLAAKFPRRVQPIFHEKNRGKGAAIRSAASRMTGDICIVQDADLEYDPCDYPLVLEALIEGRAECVYGSRFMGSQPKRVLFFWHYVGNRFLTLLSNMLTNLNLTDVETGVKAFRADILKTTPIRSNRFGFDPEITAKIAKRGCRVYEVGINYNERTYEEGKKISWTDGVKAIFTIFKFWLVSDLSNHRRK